MPLLCFMFGLSTHRKHTQPVVSWDADKFKSLFSTMTKLILLFIDFMTSAIDDYL